MTPGARVLPCLCSAYFSRRAGELAPGGAAGRASPESLRVDPRLTRQPIVFVTHAQYAPDHHNTATLFVTGECNTASYRGGGSALKVLDVAQAAPPARCSTPAPPA